MIAVGGPFRPQRVQIRAGRRSASDVSGGRRIESKGTCTVRSQWAHETTSKPCWACWACAIVGAGWSGPFVVRRCCQSSIAISASWAGVEIVLDFLRG